MLKVWENTAKTDAKWTAQILCVHIFVRKTLQKPMRKHTGYMVTVISIIITTIIIILVQILILILILVLILTLKIIMITIHKVVITKIESSKSPEQPSCGQQLNMYIRRLSETSCCRKAAEAHICYQECTDDDYVRGLSPQAKIVALGKCQQRRAHGHAWTNGHCQQLTIIIKLRITI